MLDHTKQKSTKQNFQALTRIKGIEIANALANDGVTKEIDPPHTHIHTQPHIGWEVAHLQCRTSQCETCL